MTELTEKERFRAELRESFDKATRNLNRRKSKKDIEKMFERVFQYASCKRYGHDFITTEDMDDGSYFLRCTRCPMVNLMDENHMEIEVDKYE
jgi:transcription elongation factor Elf1